MKKVFFVFTAISFLFLCNARAQLKFPQPSPTQTIRQDFGLGSIELTYSRPGAKGRKVFGDLVPYGLIWRTGANSPTRITFTEPVEIAGKKIDTGSYILYTIPGIDRWEIMLNKGLKNGSVNDYKESEDAVHFKADAVKLKTKVESFTMQFADVKPETCQLQLMWENSSIAIPITTNIKEKIRAQLDAAMLTDKKPYWQAAQFYNEYDKNLPRALENITKATEENAKAFYMYLYKAKIQKEMGDVAGAKKSSQISLDLSKEAKNEDYVRMNENLMKELKRMK